MWGEGTREQARRCCTDEVPPCPTSPPSTFLPGLAQVGLRSAGSGVGRAACPGPDSGGSELETPAAGGALASPAPSQGKSELSRLAPLLGGPWSASPPGPGRVAVGWSEAPSQGGCPAA